MTHNKFPSIVDDNYEHQLTMYNYYVNLILVTEDHHNGVVNHLHSEENSRIREENYQAKVTLLVSAITASDSLSTSI